MYEYILMDRYTNMCTPYAYDFSVMKRRFYTGFLTGEAENAEPVTE